MFGHGASIAKRLLVTDIMCEVLKRYVAYFFLWNAKRLAEIKNNNKYRFDAYKASLAVFPYGNGKT